LIRQRIIGIIGEAFNKINVFLIEIF